MLYDRHLAYDSNVQNFADTSRIWRSIFSSSSSYHTHRPHHQNDVHFTYCYYWNYIRYIILEAHLFLEMSWSITMYTHMNAKTCKSCALLRCPVRITERCGTRIDSADSTARPPQPCLFAFVWMGNEITFIGARIYTHQLHIWISPTLSIISMAHCHPVLLGGESPVWNNFACGK